MEKGKTIIRRGLDTVFQNGVHKTPLKRPPMKPAGRREQNVCFTAFAQTLVGGAFMAMPVFLDAFSCVKVETGLKHYAEKPVPYFPWLDMPFNTTVNVLYFVVGLYWLMRIGILRDKHIITAKDAYMFYVFLWMGVFYGIVQMFRILLQTHTMAVLDQWYTLPIFMWVPVWACQLMYGITSCNYLIMTLSIGSYCFSLLYIYGFEVVLGIHIVLALASCVCVYLLSPRRPMYHTLCKGVICCMGFVVLKLLDHHLVIVHSVFSHLTGHFLSKICDAFQIHYVAQFFYLALKIDKKVEYFT